jgi:cytoskeletal protein CcmA (bactofilin family)
VTVGGTLAADRFRADGSLEVSGALRIAETLEVRGTLRTLAAVRAGDLVLGGTTHAMATLVADRVLRFQGSLAAPSLRAGAVEGRGAMEVPGDIEAWRVAVDLSAASHLGTVRAHIAQLHSKVPNPVEKVLGREVLVTIDRVEADEVELIGVDVGYVRSPQVTLGRGCHVTTVEGTIVAQHASADVGPRSKSPPPHGLRR